VGYPFALRPDKRGNNSSNHPNAASKPLCRPLALKLLFFNCHPGRTMRWPGHEYINNYKSHKMLMVELTKNDNELVIVNFEHVKTFFADKKDEKNGGTVLNFFDDKVLPVKEPYAEVCKLFKIATVKM
jgi:hypothetical protein